MSDQHNAAVGDALKSFGRSIAPYMADVGWRG